MKYIVLFILAILSSSVKAQYVKDKGANYEGSIELNSAASLNDTPFSMFGVETIHGVLLAEDWVFVGLGVGVNVVHFTPYVEKMTGDVTPEMFHYDLQKYVCPTVSLNLGFRGDNIRKIRKNITPFLSFKLIHIWKFKNISRAIVDSSETSYVDRSISDVNDYWGEICVGTELKLRSLPNIYVGCGWLGTLVANIETPLEWTQSVDAAETGEGRICRGSYKGKGPVVFFLKVGMHLWKRK